jgi:UDP-N-acetylmuramoyl-tripeptide--D-alanyl-D-alanine ligase
MRASVEAFCQEFAQRPKILVLGDMKELGAESKRFHRELGEWLATLPLKSVYLAGPEIRETFSTVQAAKPGYAVRHGATPETWIEELRGECAGGHAVLFKASRLMRFEEIAQSLELQVLP